MDGSAFDVKEGRRRFLRLDAMTSRMMSKALVAISIIDKKTRCWRGSHDEGRGRAKGGGVRS